MQDRELIDHLTRQLTASQAQVASLQRALSARTTAVVDDWTAGLRYAMQAYAQGDPVARQMLCGVADAIDTARRARDTSGRLATPNGDQAPTWTT